MNINKLSHNNRFSFIKLKKLFINNYNVDNYKLIDEIIVYYTNYNTKEIVKLI